MASEARTVVDLIPAHSVVRRGTKTDARSRAAETAMLSDPLPVRAAAAKHWSQQRTQFAWHRAISAARGTEEAPARPIFVLGCPRSGTSVVFALLQRHEALRSPGREGHALWNAYQHPRLKGWSSDRATHQDIKPFERRYLYTAIKSTTGDLRFLDKTPKNILKLPYLASLFPDATFVFVKRDGPDTVNSLIEGWTVRFGISYRLPQRLELVDYRGRYWCYVLPEGWRDWARTSVGDVAAFQYVESYETALDDRSSLSDHSFVDLRYEDLLQHPVRETKALLDRLELPPSDSVMEMARNLTAYPSKSTVSRPREGKWRDRAEEIARITPRITPTVLRLGYEQKHSRDIVGS